MFLGLAQEGDGNEKDWKNRTDGKKESAGIRSFSLTNYLDKEKQNQDNKKKDTNQDENETAKPE